MEQIDPAEPATFEITGDPVEEINRLSASFRRLLDRMDEERMRSGSPSCAPRRRSAAGWPATFTTR